MPNHPFTFGEFHLFEKSLTNMWAFTSNYIGENKALFISSFPMLGVGKDFFKISEKEEIDAGEKKNNNTDNNLSSEASNGSDGSDESETYHPPSLEELFTNPFSNSIYINDVIINSHPRFGTLSRNIRKRRGSKVNIKIPIYKDVNTNLTESTEKEPYPGFIHMDAMAFGMGSCCLQATIGTCSLNSTCLLYDQLIPVAPILLALSSSGPIYKGKLSGYDNRFDIISQSVDDRTEEERNPMSGRYINRSRYSPSYSYISDNIYIQDYHNDYPKMPINEDYLKKMMDSGISKRLSEHFCNLLVRDPLVIFSKKIDLEDKNDKTHFENFNSSNWNSLRFKPPKTEDNDCCFKVEFRPLDLQLTPFENTALLSVVLSLYASIFAFDVNFIIPISMVDENFRRAYLADAVTEQKFFWRINGIDKTFKSLMTDLRSRDFLAPRDNMSVPTKEEDLGNIKELTIKQILLGAEEYNYPGIIKLCQEAINIRFENEACRKYFNKFFDFMARRATGKKHTSYFYTFRRVMDRCKIY